MICDRKVQRCAQCGWMFNSSSNSSRCSSSSHSSNNNSIIVHFTVDRRASLCALSSVGADSLKGVVWDFGHRTSFPSKPVCY